MIVIILYYIISVYYTLTRFSFVQDYKKIYFYTSTSMFAFLGVNLYGVLL